MTGMPLIPRSAVPAGHGYTLADVERIAGRAARDHPSALLPYADRHYAGARAVIEAILTARERPEVPVLLRAAWDGINSAADADRRYYGTGASGYGFSRFWYQPPLSGWEDVIVDRIALGQIWAALSPAHRRVIEAYAGCDGNFRAAAELAGMTREAFRHQLRDARAAFRVLWHEGETPSRQWGRDRRAYRAGDDPEARVTSAAVARRAAVNRRRRARAAAEAESRAA